MLVHGAAGGVGTAALQVANGLGARTIAVVSTDEKERVAREAGRRRGRALRRPLEGRGQGASGGGVDLVLDPVGGDRFTDSLRSLREGGRVVVVGFTGGSIPEVKVNRLLLNNTEVDRRRLGRLRHGQARGQPRRSARRWTSSSPAASCAPIVGARFPLDRAADALKLIDGRGATGKVVLDVREG